MELGRPAQTLLIPSGGEERLQGRVPILHLDAEGEKTFLDQK